MVIVSQGMIHKFLERKETDVEPTEVLDILSFDIFDGLEIHM
jgi:hypothetical protein